MAAPVDVVAPGPPPLTPVLKGRGWRSTVREFVRLLVPGNGLLTIVVTVAAYFATKSDAKWWWTAILLTSSFSTSLLINWCREKFLGVPEQRLAEHLAEAVKAPVGEAVAERVSEQVSDLESHVAAHHDSVKSSLVRVEALLETTAHGHLAESIGFLGIALPHGPESNSLGRCLETATPRQQLWVMGLQANKWINYLDGGGRELRRLLEVGMSPGAEVRFLLLDPNGVTINKLSGSDGEPVAQPKSVELLEQMARDHANLKIEYYDEVPRFRMVFCDGTLIVSCYALDTMGRFRTKKGADAPHLVIREQTKDGSWPLYAAFASHYDDLWQRAAAGREPDDVQTAVKPVP